MADKEKKIIVDEDWKQQAQKEKELLKEQEKLEHQQDDSKARPPLPEADFSGLVSMLATQAFYALGVIGPEEDKDKKIEPDWPLAKFNIDMLAMVEEKCKGNLTDDEAHLIKSTLEQLRMLFVQLSQKD